MLQFGGMDVGAEWIIRDNVPGLQEVASFVPMMERVVDEPGITFYCHAKGVTHADDDAGFSPQMGMRRDGRGQPRISRGGGVRLRGSVNVAGAFRSHGLWAFPGYHNWHFAGTWFWFRNSRAAELDCRNVHPNFMGVEAWPGIFPLAESRCLFFDNANTAHLYDNEFWRTSITPALHWWRKSLGTCGLDRDLVLSKG